MSIFPKRVTKNENVIIHLKFINDCGEMKYFHYRTSVISPSGKNIKCWENGFCMSSKKDFGSAIKEFFLCVEYSLLIEAGKYFVRTDLFLDGKIVNSRTEENDHFCVDRVEIQNYTRIDDMVIFEIKNIADNTVPIKVFNHSHKLLDKLILQPKQVRLLEYTRAEYIEYENGTIVPMKEKGIMYLKKKEYSWRINNNQMELFDDNTFESFCLPNILAFLWLNCNGLNDLDELTMLLGVDKCLLGEMINYLLAKGLIETM